MDEPLEYRCVNVCGVNYLVIDWSQVEDLALIMEDQLEKEVIKKCGQKMQDIRENTLIVGVKRWGDNVANHLSDAFEISEVRSLGIRSYDRAFKRGPPEIYQPLNLGEDLAKYKLIILADGVVDSGNTLTRALTLLGNYRPRSVISSSLLVKSHSAKFPDVYGDVVDGKYWIAFPWEKAEISRKLAYDMRNSGYKDKDCSQVLQKDFGYDQRIIKKNLA